VRKTATLFVGFSLLLARVSLSAEDTKPAKQAPAEAKELLKTDKAKISYCIGMNMARGMKSQGVDIDVDIMARAIKDVFAGGDLLLTEEESREVLTKFRDQMMAQMQQKRKEQAEKGKKEGEAYLEANKKKEGVKTLPSGLQYQVLKEGNGPSPKPTDRVKVHYAGTLTDGTEFDSSVKRDQPAVFGVTQVIKGWTEALPLMKVGDKWKLVIPPALAYGERGSPPKIGPNSVLVFEIELLSIEPPATQPAMMPAPAVKPVQPIKPAQK